MTHPRVVQEGKWLKFHKDRHKHQKQMEGRKKKFHKDQKDVWKEAAAKGKPQRLKFHKGRHKLQKQMEGRKQKFHKDQQDMWREAAGKRKPLRSQKDMWEEARREGRPRLQSQKDLWKARQEQEYDKMPWDAMELGGDPCAWRYYDYPRPGSIYRMLDIPQLVRGPTVVLMPSGKEIQVPAQVKQMVSSPAETFDIKDSKSRMSQLFKLLSAKQGPSAPAGFKIGQAPAFQVARNHPRERLRTSRHGEHTIAF